MSWKIVLHEEKPESPKIGDAWYNKNLIEGENKDWYMEHYLSPEYKKDWVGKRPPLFVCLPSPDSNLWFCIDSMASNGNGSGWTVTGDPPGITVSPSINYVGIYHGWIRNGEITEDCEGRKY